METRALSPPATYDGLLPREITIQSIRDLLMAGLLCLRDTLSRGVSAYLASRVKCISTRTQCSEMLKCSNLNRHPQNWDISIYRINRGSLNSDPWASSSLDLGYPAKIMPMLARHHMYINHRYRADTNKS